MARAKISYATAPNAGRDDECFVGSQLAARFLRETLDSKTEFLIFW